MFLNIITPCSRPENLHIISKSINIPEENYRWIVVFDMDEFPPKELIPPNCEIYLHRNPNSTVGHSQRNFAINIINEGHIYMNDDDTIIHSELWENIKELNNDFISFSQEYIHGNLRLIGRNIKVGYIDSHNFIVSRELIGDDRWIINKYDADGYFATLMYQKSQNPEFINKTLSTYNSLR
jgi:hypothetical protein